MRHDNMLGIKKYYNHKDKMVPTFDLEKIIAVSNIGEFLGISQETFDRTWNNLTNSDGNSVTYISMEIGADLDIYNPIKDMLLSLPALDSNKNRNKIPLKKILHGPGKIPNYSGGLGILAGDTLKSFADCKLPVLAISLLYRQGYFSQFVDSRLGQLSQTVDWNPHETPCLYLLRDPNNPEEPLCIDVPFYNEYDQVTLATAQIWMKIEASHDLTFFIPELLVDFSLTETPSIIRSSAGQLYNSESSMIKAIQRRMLGSCIIPVMHTLGITSNTIHLNEQHGVAVAMHLIAEELHMSPGPEALSEISDHQIIEAAKKVSERLIYTIHTPVKAGHDRFDKTLYAGISHASCQRILDVLAHDDENPHTYNFTNFAMRVNRATNSVSRLHRDVTQKQFPNFAKKITAITNGVHHLTWISKARKKLFDSFPEISTWRDDPGIFSSAEELLNNNQFRSKFREAWKTDTAILIKYVNSILLQHRNQMTKTWIDPPNYFSSLIDNKTQLNPNVFTIGFARRFSTYKRADLIFDDIGRLCDIVLSNNWPITFLFAGKAHPADEPGKNVIKLILDYQEELYKRSNGLANLIFIPNYDMEIAQILVSGVHVWLNNPKRPLEASGTSGMKAAMNGVPNISIMDGWWVEGYHEGKTGWKFGHEGPIDNANLGETREELLYQEDSNSFYQLLPSVLNDFYEDPDFTTFLDKSIMNLVLNIPIFNTHRMAAEYLVKYDLQIPKQTKAKMEAFAQLYSSDN